jgi:hypothetical protein
MRVGITITTDKGSKSAAELAEKKLFESGWKEVNIVIVKQGASRNPSSSFVDWFVSANCYAYEHQD